MMAPSNLLSYAGAALLAYVLWLLRSSPLKNVPGPFLAKLTNIWRMVVVASGKSHEILLDLHKQHGSIVRIGPNVLSLADPQWIKIIYPPRGGSLKSDFYSVNDVMVDGKRTKNMFGTQDPDEHMRLRKPVAALYTLSNVLSYEPQIDAVMDLFVSTLETVGREGCDLGRQLSYLAYDVIGNMTFGKPHGYLEKQSDFDDTISSSDRVEDYFAMIGQMPWLDNWLAKNPVFRIGPPSFDRAAGLCYQMLVERKAEKDRSGAQRDFLDDILEIDDQNFGLIIGRMFINVVAGADTTAIHLKAAVYYLLKNPRTVKKLQQELDNAQLSLPLSYNAVKQLPYLDACLQESQRLHPAVGLSLERVAPKEGIKLPNGPFIEEGTIIGMNSWIVHKDQNIYGEDAGVFKPERWLPDKGESKQAFEARKRAMKDTDLTFSTGDRACLGKWVAVVEIYKVIATLFLLCDMELMAPEKNWRVINSWFVRQEGLEVKVTKRNASTVS